jgi:diadenosine tetraphosphate (Ap4A) HIT family hydrolase
VQKIIGDVMTNSCLFCELYLKKDRILYENKTFWTLFDKNPVTNGHALAIPKRHVISFFDLKKTELSDLLDSLQNTKEIIDDKFNPDSYNMGINDGESAGRTIHHLHVHLIPRYKGDVENPVGGVRNIIPGKGEYLRGRKE